MTFRTTAFVAVTLASLLTACDSKKQDTQETMSQNGEQLPPIAKIDDVVDTHWGVEVHDPYRYMEETEDPYVRSWFEGQAEYADSVLSQLPARDDIYARLQELDQGAPFSTNGVKELATGDVFYLRREAGGNLSKLYRHASGDAEPQLLVDPETVGDDGEQHFSIATYQPSWDGKHLVYGLAQGGSEETTYHILDLNTGEVVDAPISNIETAYNRPQWSADNKGFYYSRRRDLPEDAPDTEIYKETSVRYHALGTDPENDPVIASFGHSDQLPLLDTDFPSLVITPGADFAVLKVKHGDNNEISLFSAPLTSLQSGNIPWARVAEESQLVKDFAVSGNTIYLMTAQDAPRFKLVATSLIEPNFAAAQEVIAASELVLDGVASAKDAIYIEAKRDGISRIMRLAPDSPAQILPAPRGGATYVSAISPALDGLRIYETSWIQGGVRYIYDPSQDSFVDDGLIPKGKFDSMEGFVAKEVLVESHDGTMVPVSILHRADIELDGSNPAIVYGYGSYSISMDVGFSPIRMAWLERGGIYAIAHVRGGGEYGQEWHYAGRMQNKPNTWLDLIATAKYLAHQGYSSPAHMAPMGGSAGGILVGRSITTEPDLFGAAVAQVGMLDAIRAETTTNGVPNIKEFGTVTEKEGFESLLDMSSYHNVKDGVSYPRTLLTHGFNDPRVNPWMSGKMAARLQAVGDPAKPALLRIDFDSGHGIGSTRDQILAQYADIYAFLLSELAPKS